MNIKEIFYKIDDSIIKENNGYRFYMNQYGLNKIELTDDFYNEIETLRDGLMGQDSWYGAQVSVGDSMWLDPHQSVKNDSMVVPFITFIKCKGEAVGIIGVEIDVNDITENIYKMKVMNTGYGTLLSRNGNIICEGTRLEKTSEYREASYVLRNNMLLVLKVGKNELYPVSNSNIIRYSLLVILVIFFLVLFVEFLYRYKGGAYTAKKESKLKSEFAVVRVTEGIIVLAMVLITSDSYINIVGSPWTNKIENYYGKDTIVFVGGDDILPFCYEEEGIDKGLDILLAEEISKRLGVRAEIRIMDLQDAINAMDDGEADVVLGCDDDLFAYTNNCVLSEVTTPDSYVIFGKNNIDNINVLEDKNIAVFDVMTETNRYQMQSNIRLYNHFDKMLTAVETGECDYTIMKKSMGDALINKLEFTDIRQVYDLSYTPMCLGIRKGDKELVKGVNEALLAMKSDGTMSRLKNYFDLQYNNENILAAAIKNQGVLLLFFLGLLCALIIGDIYLRMRKKEEVLIYASETDAMTGLYNRANGEQLIDELLLEGNSGMLIFTDVDRFKSINDSLGHQAGDEVIRSIAKALVNSTREDDVVLRLGGDEFVIFTPGIEDRESANAFFDRLFKEIGDIKLASDPELRVTLSAGAAFSKEHPEANFSELYALADEATYKSKKINGSAITYN